jgi:glucose/arabinose dehydrogenase
MRKIFILLAQLACSIAVAQPNISLSQFGTATFSLPVCVAHCNDSRMFVVEQRGKIFVVDSVGAKRTTPFLTISNLVSQSGNERGLLGLAFHPQYKQNGYFYVNYTRSSDGATRVSRFSVNPADSNLAQAASELNLLTIAQPFSNHNGGNIKFGPDGYLYIGMGDGGSAGDPNNNAQNPQSMLGKMLRIDVNGSPYSVPPTNPYVGNSQFLPEIWSYGLRNPWRWSFDRVDGSMWIGDVGQNIVEEVNVEAPGDGGNNYGWRCYEGNTAYNTAGCAPQSTMTPAIFTYNHSTPNGCSITGGYVYRGVRYQNLFGYYLVTDYCSGRIWWIRKNIDGTFSNGIEGSYITNNYVSFGEDYLGELYLLGIADGKIYRISEATDCPVAYVLGDNNRALCPGDTLSMVGLRGRNMTYSWLKNGAVLPGANAHVLSFTEGGSYRFIIQNASGCADTSDVIQIVVPQNPGLTILGLDSVYIQGNPADTLSANVAGTIFSINGVASSIVDPSALAPGTLVVQAVYTDTLGCTWMVSDTAQVISGVGIRGDVLLPASVSLVPNPASDGVWVVVGASTLPGTVIRIYDLSGRKLVEQNGSSGSRHYLPLVGLEAGTYLVQVASPAGMVTKKLNVTQ